MIIKYRADLYKLLPENAIIAELGCAEGLFSSDILRWPNCKTLMMVDAWRKIERQPGDGGNNTEWHDKNYQGAMSHINFAIDRVNVLRGLTWDMALFVEDGTLDLLYIDACHDYGCVVKDLAAWGRKVKSQGIIALHDYLAPEYGVKKAADEYAASLGTITNLITENKSEDAGAWIRNP